MKTNASLLKAYAITPIHAGSGTSVGVVDNPIQRERHTNWPVVASSGVKGAMRAHFDKHKHNITDVKAKEQIEKLTDNIFGTDADGGYAGSLSVSDLKILAFPMRSSVAPFVWVTSPAIIKRLEKDLKLIGKEVEMTDATVQNYSALCWSGGLKGRVLLEDMEVTVSESNKTIPETIKDYFADCERLLVVSDQVFDYAVSHCTSVLAQIKIDQKTGTTPQGSLRYQEELPNDTLMYSVVFWGDSRNDGEIFQMDTIKNFVTKEVIKDFIQIGGDETCGRGIFEIEWK